MKLAQAQKTGPQRSLVQRMSLQLIVAATAVATVAGCAQDREDISRVQPNATKKSELLGREWYLRSTVVQTSFGVGSTFPGAMSKMVRGVFDIQERALYFYRTYEFMEGSEAYAQKSDVDIPMKDANGKPVTHAVPEDYQQISCDPNGNAAECGKASRCANKWRADKWPEEENWHGNCVRLGKKYVYRGAPVLGYPISSHFDIVRGYSTATGEENNVLSENASDRKWFDREYMRVAWGGQSVTSYDHDVLFDTAAAGGSTIIYEGENAPEGEGFEKGATKLNDTVPQQWFHYIAKVVAAPASTYLEGFGQIPICFFYPWYAGGVFDCNSEELKIRYSFLEVPKFSKEPERAYVARDSDDVEMEKFGYFRTERPVFDIQFGNTHNGAIRRVERHRIWDKYVKCNVNPKDDKGADGKPKCVTESKDTVWRGDFDYSKMTPVPVVYYINSDHPRDLVSASIEITRRWSEAFDATVAAVKGKKADHPMYILCENSDADAKAAKAKGLPVAEWSGSGTPAAKFCKEMDQPHRFGDLRWSVMHAVPNPIQVGLYGYGPSAADPLTGEIVAASAHAYVGVMKPGAEAALQNLELLAGVKDWNDIKRADEKKFTGYQITSLANDGPSVSSNKSLAAVQAEVAGMMDPDVRGRLQNEGLPQEDNGGTYAQGRFAKIKQAPELNAMVSGDDDGHTIPLRFKDPRVTTAKGPMKYTADQLQAFSLANWNHTAARISRDKASAALAEKTIHFQDFADNAILGLADEYGRRYDAEFCKVYAVAPGTLFTNAMALPGSAAEVCTTEAEYQSAGAGNGKICAKASDGKSYWKACATKSLMQTIRVALNKANGGSPLAESYRVLPGPLYTDTVDPVIRATQEIGRPMVDTLRGKFKAELLERIYMGTQEHEVGHTLGLRHNFEASTDAMNFTKEFWTAKLKAGSNDEVANPLQQDTYEQAIARVREKQLASVMDYTSKFNGRYAGVGLYDRAAIKFGYGNLVEVFENFKPTDLDADPDGVGPLAPAAKYLETPAKSTAGLLMLQHQGNQDMNILNRRLHWSTLPKYFKGVDNMLKRKDVSWTELKGDRCEADADCTGGKKCAAFGEDKFCRDASVVEVPYRFCSDEYNGQTPNCATWDEGLDAYEIARNAMEDYENYWWFYGWARDSEIFYPNNYAARVERSMWTATRQFQFWAVDFATNQKDGWWKKRYGVEYDQDINGGLAGAYSTLNTFNTLAQALGRPGCGFFGWNPVKGRYEPYTDVDQAQWTDIKRVDEVMGCRPLYPNWSYDGYVTRPESGGQMYDRLSALAMLTDPTYPSFIATNESEDTRRYLVSFYNVFPRQLTNLLASMSVEDATAYGWQVVAGKNSDDDKLVPRPWVGSEAQKQRKLCGDLPTDATDAEREGCLKYNVFPDARPVFPSSRFRMPLQAAYYGMAVLTKGFNRTFLDVSRVFLKGHHQQIDLPADLDSKDVATFTDPLSGKTYIAPKVTDETLNPGYLAVKLAEAELKKWTNLGKLQENYLFSEYQFRVSLLDIMRSMHEVYEK
jgi:hypothetical protein